MERSFCTCSDVPNDTRSVCNNELSTILNLILVSARVLDVSTGKSLHPWHFRVGVTTYLLMKFLKNNLLVTVENDDTSSLFHFYELRRAGVELLKSFRVK